METLEPILAEHPFFRELARPDLHLLVGCASNVVFEAGKFIFREGEDANSFYLIRQGKVALEAVTPERHSVIVQTLGKGEVLGWSWLVPPYHWCFDAKAVDLTRAIALNGKCLREKCDENPRLGYELLKGFARIMAERLQAARMQMLDIYGTNT